MKELLLEKRERDDEYTSDMNKCMGTFILWLILLGVVLYVYLSR